MEKIGTFETIHFIDVLTQQQQKQQRIAFDENETEIDL